MVLAKILKKDYFIIMKGKAVIPKANSLGN
jgi:hypothetical protein